MSGGEGTRLRPITNIIPKPLIPLGKSTVLEQIISNFRINGFEKILISINYFSELVTTYLAQKGIKNIKFINEKKKVRHNRISKVCCLINIKILLLQTAM